MALVSRRGFAKEVGVSEGAVRKAIANGRIEITDDGKIDLETALTQWADRRDTSKVRSEEPDADEGEEPKQSGPMFQARLRRENAVADLRELDYKRRLGELVDKTLARRAFFESARQFRDAVTNMPVRIAAAQAAAILKYLKSALADHLSAKQMLAIGPVLHPKAIEAVVSDTMSAECRAILESLAREKPPILN